jgi:protein O-GlcNAc transferase
VRCDWRRFNASHGGHPITSGLPNIDHFFSSELMEPEGAQRFYSEELICLPGIGICYQKPVIPTPLFSKTRSEIGVREDAIVYLSCQSTFKYLPDHDHVFAEIARRVPNSQFVFLVSNPGVGAAFYRRVASALAAVGLDAEGRCVLLPSQNKIDYWNVNSLSDVYLDTIEWSGCNSTMEAIACKLPMVTTPAGFMHGRHTAGILAQLEVTGTIAWDKAEYLSLAARLGLDRPWRERV